MEKTKIIWAALALIAAYLGLLAHVRGKTNRRESSNSRGRLFELYRYCKTKRRGSAGNVRADGPNSAQLA